MVEEKKDINKDKENKKEAIIDKEELYDGLKDTAKDL
jgi:hypothetical protein